MSLSLRMSGFRVFRREVASQRARLAEMMRAGLVAFCIVLAFSTQLLFQFDLYANWPFGAILLGWWDQLVDHLVVGACTFVAVVLATLVPMKVAPARHMLVGASIALGALAGEAFLAHGVPLPEGVSLGVVLTTKTARWVAIGALAYAFFLFRRQAEHAAEKAHESDLQRIQIELRMTQARVESLRAYIEPHFLFNTLANVRELYGTDPERGRAMLANFIAYVRAALPQMRHGEVTLRQDVDLARAYLSVLQVRMGARLRVKFDVPEGLAGLPFPPLALSTLTENAIKHGLNPLPEGGAIEVTARGDNGRLTVCVADTGIGLRGSGGTGSGLANLRARLAASYGDTARVHLEANAPRGIRVTISIPMHSSLGQAA